MKIDKDKKQELDSPALMRELGDEEFTSAVYALFNEFRDGHREFWSACKINEMFYMGDHWNAAQQMGMSGGEDDVQPVTPVLFSTIDNLESDLRNAMPEAVYLPQTLEHKRTARELTQIVEQTLEDSAFDITYDKWVHDALVCGTGVIQTVYDEDEFSGLGAAVPRYLDIKNFMADPMYEDIQDGRACFKFTRVRPDWLYQHYPDKFADVSMDAETVLGQRDNNSPIEQTNAPGEAALIEYWYREYDPEKSRWKVHMALFAGGVLLEDSSANFPDGYYDHGQFPFAVLSLFPIKGTYLGFSLIEVFATLQIYSDKLDQIVLINAALSGNPRMLVSNRANIDLAALGDPSSKVITGDRIDANAMRQLDVPPVPQGLAQLAQTYREVLKEESGQNQFGRGEGGKGITAASAILALQEASGKRSLKLEKRIHAVFRRDIANQLIELIRQFYDEGHVYIVSDVDPETGTKGEYEIEVAGGRLGRQERDGIAYADMPAKLLVKTKIQRAKIYDTQYYNDFALQLLQYGEVDMLDLIDMMHFDGKEQVREALTARRQYQQQMEQLQAAAEQAAQQLEAEKQFNEQMVRYMGNRPYTTENEVEAASAGGMINGIQPEHDSV